MKLIGEHPVDLADGAVLKLWHYRVADGERDAEHVHDWAQLDWSPTGVLTVDVDDSSWIVPPSVAFWIPAGVCHAVGASRAASLRHVTFYPSSDVRLTEPPFDEPLAVGMTPLMIELLNRLVDPGLTRQMRGRIGEVFVDSMVPARHSTFRLPLPSDDRAAAIARRLMEQPTDDRSLTDWGRSVGASRRTLVRLFTAETGMTFVQWRTMCRIQCALPLLAAGRSVGATAHLVGYHNVSAFIAAFRRTIGLTPRAYQLDVTPTSDRRARW